MQLQHMQRKHFRRHKMHSWFQSLEGAAYPESSSGLGFGLLLLQHLENLLCLNGLFVYVHYPL